MVCAILEGRKTQTRRVVTLPSWATRDGLTFDNFDEPFPPAPGYGPEFETGDWGPCPRAFGCPYGVPGDRLWVREVHWRWGKWARNGVTKSGRMKWKFIPVGTGLRYQDNRPKTTAKRDGECGWVYRHSRFMFRAHSRITLELTDVRVQRVQEISEEDAQAEGIEPIPHSEGPNFFSHCNPFGWHNFPTAKGCFADLWDSINAKRGSGWDANLWVWALTFQRVVSGVQR